MSKPKSCMPSFVLLCNWFTLLFSPHFLVSLSFTQSLIGLFLDRTWYFLRPIFGKVLGHVRVSLVWARFHQKIEGYPLVPTNICFAVIIEIKIVYSDECDSNVLRLRLFKSGVIIQPCLTLTVCQDHSVIACPTMTALSTRL